MAYAFRLPDIGEGLHEAEITCWLVAEGDSLVEDQPLVEVQTDKATVELPSPVSGTVRQLHYPAGALVKVGAVLVTIAQDEEERREASRTRTGLGDPTVTYSADIGPRKGRWAPATPSTRRLGRELGVDVNQLTGSGPGGRVTGEDVRLAAASLQKNSAFASNTMAVAAGLVPKQAHPPASVDTEEDRRVPLRGIRRAIARRMIESVTRIPHAVVYDEADMGTLLELRKDYQEIHPDRRLTLLTFLVKAVATALQRCRILNAVFDETTQEVVERAEINVGIATATPAGLTVPVVHQADLLSIWKLAAKIQELTERARAGRINPEDVRGGTFTLNNTGAIGGLSSIPIINHPEVGILSVHQIRERPVGRGGQVVLRPMAYLALAFDHRVLDGDEAIGFLNQIIRCLERPNLIVARWF